MNFRIDELGYFEYDKVDDSRIKIEFPEYSGTYAIVNKRSRKAYIGTTSFLYQRVKQHTSALNTKTHTSKEFIADWERGAEFVVELYPDKTEQELFDEWKNELYNRRKAAGNGSTGEAKYPIERWQNYRGYLLLNRRKKVQRYEVTFGELSFCIFSLSEFATVTGLDYAKLYEVARGKRTSHKGFKLKLV